jgi:uncharacterized protein (TIGR00251 family)
VTWLRDAHGGIALDVLVAPRSSRERVGPIHDDRLKLAVTAPPVDGEANAAVIDLLARTLGVPRTSIAVVAGTSSRRKTIAIAGIGRDAVEKAIAS